MPAAVPVTAEPTTPAPFGPVQAKPGPVAVRATVAAQVTAELPEGRPFQPSGDGTWHEIAGLARSAGSGAEVYTYAIDVENGLDPAGYGGEAAFADAVDATLADPRGWAGTGQFTLRRAGAGTAKPDFRISLTSPATAHRPDLCGFEIPYESSCNLIRRKRVVINLARWIRGAVVFGGDLASYRSYAVNHEVGHALGKSHVGCPAADAPAPVMMQQSFGVSNDYLASLNGAGGQGTGPVPADGKTCRPHAWLKPNG
jgi:hypothetical protein